MNSELQRLLHAHSGILTRSNVLAVVEHDVLDHALSAGQLFLAYPCVYLDPRLVTDREALTRAALLYADGRAALSHLSALAAWRLPAPGTGPIHLITRWSRHLRGTPSLHSAPGILGTPGLLVHRCRALTLTPPEIVKQGGFPVTCLERSIIDSWPLLDKDAKRAPAICAVGRRMTTPDRLAEALGGAPRLAGRRHLVDLLGLLRAGCRSHLEIWGYERVFRGEGMPMFRWQTPIQLGRRKVYLDVFHKETRTNFELDGAQYHSSDLDRERDLRRDAALATLGITVVRFTHRRLVSDPEGVRAEVLAILGARLSGASSLINGGLSTG